MYHFSRLKQCVDNTHGEIRQLIEKSRNDENFKDEALHKNLEDKYRQFSGRCNDLGMMHMYKGLFQQDNQGHAKSSPTAFFEVLFEDFIKFSGVLEEDELLDGGSQRRARDGPTQTEQVMQILTKMIGTIKPRSRDSGHEHAQLVLNFFWGFAYQCFKRGPELRRMLELMMLVKPESVASETFFYILANSRIESGEEPFMQSWLVKSVLSVLVFSQQDIDAFITDTRSKVRFYQTLEALLRELQSNLLFLDSEDSLGAQPEKSDDKKGKKLKLLSLEQFFVLQDDQQDQTVHATREAHSSADSGSESEAKTSGFGMSIRRDRRRQSSFDLDANLEEEESRRTIEDPRPSLNIYDNIKYIREVVENHPELEDIFKDLQVKTTIQEIKQQCAKLKWRKVDWELNEKTQSQGPAQSKEKAKHKTHNRKFTNVLNQKILNYFLFRTDPVVELKRKARVKGLNSLFQFCSFRVDRETFQAARGRDPPMSGDGSSKRSESDSDGDRPRDDALDESIDQPDGVFFDFYRQMRARPSGEEREVFRKLLVLLMRGIIQSIMSGDSVSIVEFVKFRRVFDIFVKEGHQVSSLIGVLANRSIEAFKKLRKYYKLKSNAKKFLCMRPETRRSGDAQSKREILDNFISKSKKKGKLKVPNNVRVQFKFYIMLSWLFESTTSDLLVFFIDKLSMYWHQHFYQDFVKARIADRAVVDIGKFAAELEELISAYEIEYQKEEDCIASLRLDPSRDLCAQVRRLFERRAKKKIETSKTQCFQVKIERMDVFLKKIEIICILRNMAEAFAKQVTLDRREHVERLASVFRSPPGSGGNPKIRETIRLFFLNVLDGEFGILSRFHKNIEPLFPESTQLEIDSLSLVDAESLKRLRRIEEQLADPDRTVKQKFKFLRSTQGAFYLFAVLVLNRSVLRSADSRERLANVTILDEIIANVIGLFERSHKTEYRLLSRLHQGLPETSALSLQARSGPLDLKQKILIYNILIWTVFCGERHPLFGLLADMMADNNETRKYHFNARDPNQLRNSRFVTDRYVPHAPSADALNILGSEAHSRLWHLIVHGFFVALLELDMINANILLKPVEKSSVDSEHYFLRHFANDTALLSDASPNVDIWAMLPVLFLQSTRAGPSQVDSPGANRQDISSLEDALKFAENFGRRFAQFKNEPERLSQECQEVFKALSRDKAKVKTETLQLLERTLPQDTARTLIEPFLFSNLRNTKLYKDSDLLHKLQSADEAERARTANLQFILKNLVGPPPN